MWAIDEGRSLWWLEDIWGAPTDDPEIDWMVENTQLGQYLPPGASIETNRYVYDNDDDTFDADGDGCADSMLWRGVSLNIWDQKLLDAVEIADEIT
ncbi:MAG: hypothetical protein KatS3mg100_621 [Candidatus Parcubacteria bacterium]|nr:MAG: hypothetical protein KatS3mg100_621 [Candidatus Parcubacteria bacterium]